MKKYFILYVVLLCFLPSCMSLMVSKRKVFKWPEMGAISTHNVGDKMIAFSSYRGYYNTGNEITYNGIAGNVLKLSFSEYSYSVGSESKNPKSQYFEFTLLPDGQPTEITIRDYRIKVLSADNNSIKFILLSGMSPLESE